jgi:hypothetical protein
MHGSMADLKENGGMINRKVRVSTPLAASAPDLNQRKSLQADMDGRTKQLTLSWSSPCKNLKIIEPQSCVLERIQEDSVYSDTEVTWAVQVLDRIIMLAKQWHIVANPSSYGYNSVRQPISESKSTEEDQQTEQLQIQPYRNHSPLSPKTSEEFPELLQVQDADYFQKRRSLGQATMMHEGSMQETQLDSVKTQTESQSLLERSKAVKTHDMKWAKDLRATIQEPEMEPKQWHSKIHVSSKHSLEDIRAEFQQFPPQSLEEFELHEDNFHDAQIGRQRDCKTLLKGGTELAFQQYPSPTSFTFEHSPNSVCSEDQLTARTSKRLYIKIPQDQLSLNYYDHVGAVSSCEDPDGKPVLRTELEYPWGAAFKYRDSPTSILSEDPDEQSHPTEVSDSSEWMELRYPYSSTFVYRDESSDSESLKHDPCEQLKVMKAAAATSGLPSHLPVIHTAGVFHTDLNPRFRRPTKEAQHDLPEQTEIQAESGEPCSPGFAYTDSPVSVLPKESTMDYQRSETAASSPDVDFSELQLFQHVTNWESWLQRDGDSLDEADLQFLFPSHTQRRDTISSEDVLREDRMSFCSLTPKTQHLQELQNQWLPSSELGGSRGGSKRHQELSKSIEQLARNLSKRHSMDIPWSENTSSDDDEEIFPSVKSWEIQEDEGPKNTPTQHCHQKQQGKKTVSYVTSHHSHLTSFVPSSPKQRSSTALVPCGGRLFSWPGWILTFNASKVRFKDTERRPANMKTIFGGPANRPAQTVKSSVNGSHKSHAAMTVADILRGDLGEEFRFSTVVGVCQQCHK